MFTVIEWKFPVFFWGPFGCIVILLYGKLSIYNESLEYEKSGIFRLLDHWYAKLSICNESLKEKIQVCSALNCCSTGMLNIQSMMNL